MMETMIPPQVGMRLRTEKKEKRPQKREKAQINKKMREKERRDNVTILLPHLCFKGTYCIVAIEDKKMGFISDCLSLSLYIMSSCLMRYSVLMNIIL